MAISFVKDGGTNDTGNTTSKTFTVPAGGHALGNLVGIFASGGTNPTAISVSDTRGNTWTTNLFWDAGNFSWVFVAASKLSTALIAGDVITLTLTGGSDCNGYTAEYVSTVGFAAAKDQSTSNSNAHGNSWNPWGAGGITTTSPVEVFLAAVADDNNTSGNSAPAANWNERRDNAGVSSFRGLTAQDRFVTTAGAYSGTTGTWTTADDGPAAIITWPEVAAAGGPPILARIPNRNVGPMALRRRLRRTVFQSSPGPLTTAVSSALAAVIEALAGISTSQDEPLDSAQGISATTNDPVEAAQAIAATAADLVEAAQLVSSASSEPIETTGVVAATSQGPVEALGGISRATVDPIELGQAIAGALLEQIESLGLATTSSLEPIESTQGLSTSASDPVETVQGVATTATEPIEATGGIKTTGLESIEALQGVAAAPSDPIEAQGNTPVSQALALAVEALGGVAAAPDAQLDAAQQIAKAVPAPTESLAAVAATSTEAIEASQQAVKALQASIESLTSVLVAVGIPADAAAAVGAATAILAIESLLGSGVIQARPADTARTRSGPTGSGTSSGPGSGITRTSPISGLVAALRAAVSAGQYGSGTFGSGVFGGEANAGDGLTSDAPAASETTSNLEGQAP